MPRKPCHGIAHRYLPKIRQGDLQVKHIILFLVCLSTFLHPEDYGIILERNIFAPVKEAPSEQDTGPKKEILPVIKLPAIDELFDLKGTFFAKNNPEESIAILENKKDREMDFYRIGDTVESALITGIEDNRVLFEYGFQEIELTAKGSSPVRVQPDSEYSVNLEELMHEFAKEALEPFHPAAEPVVENGKTAGFLIKGLHEKSLLQKYGIQNNDVITKINTILLDSPEKPFYAYENIMKHGIKRVSVQIYRDNLPYTLLYHLR